MSQRSMNRLRAEEISVGYPGRTVLDAMSLDIPDGKVTAIVGPNACGKSTLLRALARLIPTQGGRVMLDGRPIEKQRSRQVARRLAILPQSPAAPEGLTVLDLVRRGRTPHQSVLRQWSRADAEAVERALSLAGLEGLSSRMLDTLSGGQRQRAWIAMALAQDPELLLLDEPTTYLDLPRQIELLALIRQLNRDAGLTVAMVLHDVNLAARFADHIVALKDGKVRRQGPPAEVVTAETMQEVFSLPCTVIRDPVHGRPHVIPA
ncbi:ABC transporter ATP-binding protein [Oceanicella actignis]|uniref:Iron complex transport system ATP-binding protein n=1 Tax=Oceanicella actignis TaxID=1189325 RepID=A0A1M7SF92_9RHOB|nr:ABC transporter ATP-binding protein [Oceanicella actignis]SET22687.1 iron complex transport system ATP-binding protein [Oceanicella actignis]SHN57143.1 iron complex transport system ATP-binding protein [Oceanicella actignis]